MIQKIKGYKMKTILVSVLLFMFVGCDNYVGYGNNNSKDVVINGDYRDIKLFNRKIGNLKITGEHTNVEVINCTISGRNELKFKTAISFRNNNKVYTTKGSSIYVDVSGLGFGNYT